MLDAAENVLERHGAEGLTLAQVAAEAKLSAANVYRRFRDKEALMEAVFSRFAEVNAQELAQPVDTEQIRKIGIRQFARNWIAAMIAGFRSRTGLIRAAVLYSQQHRNRPFVRRKAELEVQSFRKMVELFLQWRDEIRRPDPERAVSFAMVMVAMALRELIIFGHAPMFQQVASVSDDDLRRELPRAFLQYLGIEET